MRQSKLSNIIFQKYVLKRYFMTDFKLPKKENQKEYPRTTLTHAKTTL